LRNRARVRAPNLLHPGYRSRRLIETRRAIMFHRNLIGMIILSVALSAGFNAAAASDEAKYPNLKGQWSRFAVPGVGGQPSYDQTKLWASDRKHR
jgi:hypothetical protein